MAESEIEWTDLTWNPTTGCDRVSPGCDHCYALTMAQRLKGRGNPKYQRDGDLRTSGPGFGLSVHHDTLNLPLRWKKPRRIFVNSMSDLFHKDVPDEFIARVWAVMAATPQHTYQILTKRHGRMRSLLTSSRWPALVLDAVRALPDETDAPLHHYDTALHWAESPELTGELPHPLLNVWLGVSVEDQQRADLRIPALLETPAVVRFLSCEPLIGPVSLDRIQDGLNGFGQPRSRSVLQRACRQCDGWGTACGIDSDHFDNDGCISWVIVGGESGPGARPMHPDWARSLRDQCQATGVPFLFKQWGAWGPAPWVARVCDPAIGWKGTPQELAAAKKEAEKIGATIAVQPGGHVYEPPHKCWSSERNGDAPGAMRRYPGHTSGRVLDGRTWDEFPAAVTSE